MILKIITPDREAIEAESIRSIHLRLADGNPISIYPGHINLIGLIGEGSIQFVDDQSSRELSVSEGLVLVNHNMIICHVNWAHTKEKIPDGQER